MMASNSCRACREETLQFDFTMAFQPIVDIEKSAVWGYEALVRGPREETARDMLSQVTEYNRYQFDQACRIKAIEAAARLFPRPDLRLSINFLPNAVYEPSACIRASLAAAERVGFSRDRIMFEFTEHEKMADTEKITRIVEVYKRLGFLTAIDDFGAGHAGLGLLAAFTPDLIKIDMELIRGIDVSRSRQVILAGIIAIARELEITLLAEGVETAAELECVRSAGIALVQGFYFARPEIDRLPSIKTSSFSSGLALV